MTTIITLPFRYIKGLNEFLVTGISNTSWREDPTVNIGILTDKIEVDSIPANAEIHAIKYDFVYHYRNDATSFWTLLKDEEFGRLSFAQEQLADVGSLARKFRRTRGRSGINFFWMHKTNMFHLVDPAPTNINDMFVIQKGYYSNYQNWLNGTANEPVLPTPLQLRNDYKSLLIGAMISDTIIFHPGKIKLVFGDKSKPQLRAQLKIVKNSHSSLTDSQIKLNVRDITKSFFDITQWDFGETFYFTELASAIHSQMAVDISSVVLVPLFPDHFFGDLFQVNVAEDEIIQADIDLEDIDIVTNINAVNTRQYL